MIRPLVMSVLLMRYSVVVPPECQLRHTMPMSPDVARTDAFLPGPPR